MKWAAVGRYRFHWKVSSSSSSMWSSPCLVRTRFMELMQPRLFKVSSLGTRSSLSSNLPVERRRNASAVDSAWSCEGDTCTYWPRVDRRERQGEAAARWCCSGPWTGPEGRQPGVWLQDTAGSGCWWWPPGRQSTFWGWAEGTELWTEAAWAPTKK